MPLVKHRRCCLTPGVTYSPAGCRRLECETERDRVRSSDALAETCGCAGVRFLEKFVVRVKTCPCTHCGAVVVIRLVCALATATTRLCFVLEPLCYTHVCVCTPLVTSCVGAHAHIRAHVYNIHACTHAHIYITRQMYTNV